MTLDQRIAIGRLRLDAFDNLKGWGTTDDAGAFHPWNMEKRMREADAMVDWAMAAGEPEIRVMLGADIGMPDDGDAK